jgi:hypothetical protein
MMDSSVKGEFGRAKTYELRMFAKLDESMEISAVLMRRLNEVLSSKTGNSFLPTGHKLTVQRFYIHHYGVRKVIGDVAHLRLDHALLFIVSRRILSGEDSRRSSVEENEQRPGYQKR